MSERRLPKWASARNSETGAVSVEFALVAPLLVLLLIFSVDLGRFFFVQISVNAAAHEAVRVGSLREVSGNDMVTFANATAPGAAGVAAGSDPATILVRACVTSNGPCVPAPLSLSARYCNSQVAGDRVFVEVSTQFRWWTPLLSITTTTISARGMMLCSI